MSWFVINNEDVSGPLTTEQVLELKNEIDINSEGIHVWGNQITEWISFNSWERSYESILSNNHKKAQAKVQTWYFAEDNKAKPSGPYDRGTLIDKVAQMENKEKILVWTKGMQAWASLFEFSDILAELNISRRKHPRAPIDGQVTLTGEDGQDYIARIQTISPGGCGISHVSGLKVGNTYQIEIKSKALYNPISAVGFVLRQFDETQFGMRFEKIHVESQSTIISYLKDQGVIKQKEAA